MSSFPLQPAPKVRKIRFKGNATAASQPDSTLYSDRDEDNKLVLVSKSGFLTQHSGLVAVIH
jgi:hypothetical protein